MSEHKCEVCESEACHASLPITAEYPIPEAANREHAIAMGGEGSNCGQVILI